MSTHSSTLDKACSKCANQLTRYHMKNPFIDDFADECSKCEPGEAMGFLNYWSRSAAREEEARDNYEPETNDEEE